MTGGEALWQAIAGSLRQEIAGGAYPEGSKLPTEAALAQRFGVNRHTVRRALGALAEEGLVVTRRGSGTLVAARPPIDYPLGRRVRFQQNVAASGRAASRRITRIETCAASAEEAALFGPGAVHVFEGVSLGDTLPLCLFRSSFPADRFPDLPKSLARLASVTAALAETGVTDYTRASTRVTAEIARGPQAGLLQVAEGSAILRTEAVNVDGAGQPVELGTSWFAADRVALTVSPEPQGS